MARIKTILPEFWVDLKCGTMPFPAQLLLIGLWTFSDDKGYCHESTAFLKKKIFPSDNTRVSYYLGILENRSFITRNDGKIKVTPNGVLGSKRSEMLMDNNAREWNKVRHKIFKRDNYTCVYCLTTSGPFQVDHVIPISKGGTDDEDNLRTACRTCNIQKKDKSLEQFITWKNRRNGTTKKARA